MLFVKSATMAYDDYKGIQNWPHDSKLNIRCESKSMLSTLLTMLRFNCSKCDYVAAGWQDLRGHAKNIHKGTLWWVICEAMQYFSPVYIAICVFDTRKCLHMNISSSPILHFLDIFHHFLHTPLRLEKCSQL